jgi:hypothetical protein
MEAEMDSDWRYSVERMNLRVGSLKILLRAYGSHLKEDGTPEHSAESIYACAHDWVSHGNPTTEGILKFYEENYL